MNNKINNIKVTPYEHDSREMTFSTLAEKAQDYYYYPTLKEYVFSKKNIDNLVLKNITFINCAFEKCTFNFTTIWRCKFIGCVFDHCDLFTNMISEVSFEDCIFIGNKLEKSTVLKSQINCSKKFIIHNRENETDTNIENKIHHCFIDESYIHGEIETMNINTLYVLFTMMNRISITPAVYNDSGLYHCKIFDSTIKIAETEGCCEMEDVELSDTSLININDVDIDITQGTLSKSYVPDGEFTGWMVEFSDLEDAEFTTYLIKILIPEDADRISSNRNQCTICKCNYAKVLSITNLDTGEELTEAELYKYPFETDNNELIKYKVGEYIREENIIKRNLLDKYFNKGITFFISKANALSYAKIDI